MNPLPKRLPLPELVRQSWTTQLQQSTGPSHPLRTTSVDLRLVQDCTFEHADMVHTVDHVPFTYFLFEGDDGFIAIPFYEGTGRYEIAAKMLRSEDYPIRAGLYLMYVNGKPAYDARTGRFHRLVNLPSSARTRRAHA